MKTTLILLTIALALIHMACGQNDSMTADNRIPVLFACYAGVEPQLTNIHGLIKSIRKFGGEYRDAPFRIYVSPKVADSGSEILEQLKGLNAEYKIVNIPEEASWYFLSGMVFSAAAAENDAKDTAKIVVFLGSDTIILQQPDEFILADGVNLGYRPVMHRNISPLFADELDSYWSRAYEIMQIDPSTVFSMVTPADGDTIRPYFNAACLATRPEKGLFNKWTETYLRLCADSALKEECAPEERRRIFTFQVALTGAILNNLDRNEIVEFSDRYNYPIFFKEMYGARYDFHDISDAVTIRYESFFYNPIPDWDQILKGPADKITWIKENFIQE
ncbi:MAG: hypothetical protein V3V99_12765 [candidate division Zixibacteria bacterium]